MQSGSIDYVGPCVKKEPEFHQASMSGGLFDQEGLSWMGEGKGDLAPRLILPNGKKQ